MSKTYVSAAEAAKRCDVSIASVRRKAHEKGLGVFVEGGRLVALALSDLPAIKRLVRSGPGNPNFSAQ